MSEELIRQLQEWTSGYDIDDAWTGAGNNLEQKLLEVVKDHGYLELDCMLYRGTGMEDGIPTAMVTGMSEMLAPSKRLVQSWTTDLEVARSFLRNAVETNHSAVLLAVHAARLKVVIDVAALLPDEANEGEVLVLNEPLTIGPEDVVEAWEYDAVSETCRQLIVATTSRMTP